MFLEPEKADNDYNNVDEAEVGKNRNQVNINLLIRLESFHVNAMSDALATSVARDMGRMTDVFRPDSVDALAPKNQASIAAMLP